MTSGFPVKSFITILLVVWMVVTPDDNVSADRTLRCSGRLISIGDTNSDVLEKCGEPDKIERWEEDHNTFVSKIFNYETERYEAPELVKGPIQLERWTYDLGSNRLIRYLLFEREQLIKIETGDKAGQELLPD